jgi:phosphatidylglycerol lysyltransferase
MVSASVLFVLLPSTGVSFPAFVGGYILAQMAGLISHVPGGLGVFESVILVLFGPNVSRSSLVGALVIYRGIYYLLPLLIAALGLATHEALQRRESLRRTATVVGRWLPAVVPRSSVVGCLLRRRDLLVSGATPGVRRGSSGWTICCRSRSSKPRISWGASRVSPCSSLPAGCSGRLDAAYLLTVPLLGIGAVVSMIKGLDYEEAAVLGVLFLSMVPCRRHFYRKTALTEQKFSPGWIAAILGVLLGSVWLGFFSYKHVSTRTSCGGSSRSTGMRRDSCGRPSAERWSS